MKTSKSKRTIRNRMDKESSIQVRARGKCERCGKTEQLQCCHIFSRRYSKLRHLPLNLLCLCAGCHFWAHSNPILFSEFCREYLGDNKFQELIDLRNDLTKGG
jgi:hypothetical protein